MTIKSIYRFIFSMTIICFLNACALNTAEDRANQSLNKKEIATSTETTTPLSEKEAYQLYDLYQITGETTEFSDTINSNPIDAEYNKELLAAPDERSIADIEKNYIIKWQQEMDDSTKRLLKALNQEDALLFEQSQEAWKQAIDSDLELTNEILHDDDYDVALGTSSLSLYLSEKREIYRNRAIKIKYIHYLIERKNGNTGEALGWLNK